MKQASKSVKALLNNVVDISKLSESKKYRVPWHRLKCVRPFLASIGNPIPNFLAITRPHYDVVYVEEMDWLTLENKLTEDR
jgi:hypothetical protein